MPRNPFKSLKERHKLSQSRKYISRHKGERIALRIIFRTPGEFRIADLSLTRRFYLRATSPGKAVAAAWRPYRTLANLVIVNSRRLLSPRLPFQIPRFFSRPHARAWSSDGWFPPVVRVAAARGLLAPRITSHYPALAPHRTLRREMPPNSRLEECWCVRLAER